MGMGMGNGLPDGQCPVTGKLDGQLPFMGKPDGQSELDGWCRLDGREAEDLMRPDLTDPALDTDLAEGAVLVAEFKDTGDNTIRGDLFWA